MKCLGRRVRVGCDEIDLVMEDRFRGGREIVFVEVKTRSSELFGGGRAALGTRCKMLAAEVVDVSFGIQTDYSAVSVVSSGSSFLISSRLISTHPSLRYLSNII